MADRFGTPEAGWRRRLHEIIFEADTSAGKAFDIALIIAILASVAVVVLSTVPAIDDDPVWRSRFFIAEWVFTALFTIEYVLRLIIVRRPWRYALSFFGIVDLLSILPAFIGLAIPHGERLLVVRTLRLLRIFRVLKLARYLSEASALRQALFLSRQKLAVFITTVLVVVLITSAVMHVAEGDQNEAFSSMPETMYWAIITMTTVGYGDVTPQTGFGKFMTSVLVLVGYSLIIIPTGILTAELATGRQEPGKVTTRSCPGCGRDGHDVDAAYCKYCGEGMSEG